LGRNHKGTKKSITFHSIDRMKERLLDLDKKNLERNFRYAVKNGIKRDDIKKYVSGHKDISKELENKLCGYLQTPDSRTFKAFYLETIYVYQFSPNARTYTLITVYKANEEFIEPLNKIYNFSRGGKNKKNKEK